MDLFIFGLKQYSVLALMCVSFWSYGRLMVGALIPQKMDDAWLSIGLALTVGLGVFIVLLQLLGAVGWLNRPAINIVLFSGLLLAAWQIKRVGFSRSSTEAPAHRGFNPWALLAIGLAATMVYRPLTIPLAWDELMYHLPHARQWAQSGYLSVNEWLRYPWFPYNFDLLYSAALLVRDDSFAHLLHALAGWLTMLLIYRVGLRQANHVVALIASCIWIFLTDWFFNTAYIELGVTLFVFASCVTFAQWLENTEDTGWLLLACFLFGVAAGSKYQALSFLPLFFLAALWRRVGLAVLLKAAFFFLVPCIYWYARNYLLSGDPFNPLGGKIFGYNGWDAGDMAYQISDLRRLSNWPDPLLWPALIAPILLIFNKNKTLRYGVVLSIYALLVWYVTSHYDRYLMPVYPVIAILSAYSFHFVFDLLGKAIPDFISKNRFAFKYMLIGILLTGLVSNFKKEYKKHHQLIGYDAQAKETARYKAIPELGTLEHLKNKPQGKIYQWGLEGVIYYAPNPIWGDHFGYWRYRDFTSFDPEILAQRLKNGGFEVLATGVLTAQGLEASEKFKQYFQEIAASPGAKAYKVIP